MITFVSKKHDIQLVNLFLVMFFRDKYIGSLLCLDTWRKDVKLQDVQDAIDKAAPGKIRVVSLTKVTDSLDC